MGLLIFLCAFSFIRAEVATAKARVVLIGPSQKLVQISNDDRRRWRLSDSACVNYSESLKDVTCGKVIVSSLRGALLLFEARQEKVAKGNPVVLASLKETIPTNDEVQQMYGEVNRAEKIYWDEMIVFYKRLMTDPETKTDELEIKGESFAEEKTGPYTHDYNLGAGVNLLGVTIRLESSLAEHWSFAMQPGLGSLSTSGVESKLLGVMATVNYYRRGIFHGWWFQAGGGYYSASSTYHGVSGGQSGYSALGTVGWRSLWTHWNLGIAAGAQLFYLRRSDQQQFSLLAVMPTVLIDLGFTF